MSEFIRFELGFRGGGAMAGEAAPEEWAKLEQALQTGTGMVELHAGSERLWVRVDELTFARKHERDRRLGFSG
jgi:hypothetical protein